MYNVFATIAHMQVTNSCKTMESICIDQQSQKKSIGLVRWVGFKFLNNVILGSI